MQLFLNIGPHNRSDELFLLENKSRKGIFDSLSDRQKVKKILFCWATSKEDVSFWSWYDAVRTVEYLK